MTGQIPKYGTHFELRQVPGYDPELAGREYVLKADRRYSIRSGKTSKDWALMIGGVPFAQRGSMGCAMALMLTVTGRH